jgi:hypothetical protein
MNTNTQNTSLAPVSSYEQTALDFLVRNGIAFAAKPAKVQTPPAWAEKDRDHGIKYRVTLSRKVRPGGVNPVSARPVSFQFWDSISAREKGEALTAYGVLACISGDVHCPDTFAEFCGEFGYDTDSRKAFATFKRCAALAVRLRAFFTETERAELSEIS